MKTFQLIRPKDSAQAIAATAKSKTAQQGAEIRFIAGGTTLIDLMKLRVEQPQNLVDLNRLPLDKIEALSDGGLTIGALVRNSDLAHQQRENGFKVKLAKRSLIHALKLITQPA
jgi:xanthine dehydrogenase YagS FAD-binding subunit